ncbi:MAG: NAD(P)/FAD-dependent oxidoreductase [Clostridia bacterium]|nr:NAD(P)/FAD-dependent oxidoreductase [Clostridia bacterium]
MAEYIIIGNGVAAIGCIEGIRSVDKTSSITVISEEQYPVYGRPLISYYLEGKTTLDKMNYRKPDFYESNGCRVLYGKRAERIDKDEKNVLLDDGTALPYTSVCVATGSTPFTPSIKGLETVQSKFSFMTLDDSLSLEKALNKDSRVLIVGAGLIGLKCAEGISKRVGSITVCDLATRVLSSILDNECAALMQARLEENGIRFMLEDTVTEFNGNKATMKSGASVEFDILVMAVGVRANTALVKELGGEVNRGILVNEQMQTSLSNIYAAGDCTEGMDTSLGERRVLAILPNAYMQGHTAGVNMTGGRELFDKAIPMNSIGFFGLHAITAGSYFGTDEGGEMYEERGDGTLKRLFTKDGVLTGFILIGQVERAGIYTSLIREKVPLDSINFDILKKNPTLFAYSQNQRRKMLGGVV